MSRQLEQAGEDKARRRAMKLARILDGELDSAIRRAGGELLGFSVRLEGWDCLLTLRVRLAGRRQIAFVGSETLGGALLKAVDLAKRDKLAFKADKYGK